MLGEWFNPFLGVLILSGFVQGYFSSKTLTGKDKDLGTLTARGNEAYFRVKAAVPGKKSVTTLHSPSTSSLSSPPPSHQPKAAAPATVAKVSTHIEVDLGRHNRGSVLKKVGGKSSTDADRRAEKEKLTKQENSELSESVEAVYFGLHPPRFKGLSSGTKSSGNLKKQNYSSSDANGEREQRRKEEGESRHEEQRRKEEEQRRMEVEEKHRKQEEKRRNEEKERAIYEEHRKQEEDERRQQEEVQHRRREEEARQNHIEQLRKEEEERRKADERRKEEEEQLRRAEEERRNQELRKLEEEQRKADERRKLEEEERKADERRKQEEEQRKTDERRKEEEQRRAEERRKEEEQRKADERRKQEEEQQKADERRKEVEQVRKDEEERHSHDEELRKQEEDRERRELEEKENRRREEEFREEESGRRGDKRRKPEEEQHRMEARIEERAKEEVRNEEGPMLKIAIRKDEKSEAVEEAFEEQKEEEIGDDDVLSSSNPTKIEENFFRIKPMPIGIVGARHRVGSTLLIPPEPNPCSSITTREECVKELDCYFRCRDETCQLRPFKNRYNDTCAATKCSDKCGCKAEGCQYSSSNGNCWSPLSGCSKWLFRDGECGRSDSFYSFGGSLCKNLEEQGSCQVVKIILAVNVNGDHYQDESGLVFIKDSPSLYNDPHGIRRKAKLGFVNGDIGKGEEMLYSGYAWAGSGGQQKLSQEGCLMYRAKICEDGRYELNIKTLESFWNRGGLRSFNVYLNDLLVLIEVDVFSLTLRRYHATDLIVNFNVSDGGQVIHWNGQPSSSPVINGTVTISLCRGECPVTDPGFVVSALSILKLVDFPVHPAQDGVNCVNYHNDPCNCSINGCEISVVFGSCMAGRRACTKCELPENPNFCLRPNAFYASDGVICKNHHATGNCLSTLETLWAVNLNGPAYTDSRGIKYSAEDTLTKWGYVSDPLKLLTFQTNLNCKRVENVVGSDRKLYDKFIRVPDENEDNQLKCNLNQCVIYFIPLCQTGDFELRINLMKTVLKGDSVFDVKFNNVTVLPSFYTGKLTEGKVCEAAEISIPFSVSTSHHLQLNGHPTPSKIIGGEVPLSFCRKRCPTEAVGAFEVSAFSVIHYSRDDKKVKRSSSQLSRSILTDINSTKGVICSYFRDDSCACKAARCEFSSVKKQCCSAETVCSQCLLDPSECRRPNVLYLINGIPCKSQRGSRGHCKHSKVILALSLRQYGSFTDHRGVLFISEDSTKENDRPDMVLLTMKPADPVTAKGRSFPQFTPPFDHPNNIYDNRSLEQRAQEMNLTFYQYFVYGGTSRKAKKPPISGRNLNLQEDNCISYGIPLHLDGKYELSVQMANLKLHSAQNGPQVTTILFNGQLLIENLHVSTYVDLDSEDELILNVNFKVGQGGKSLRLKGLPSSRIDGSQVPIKFCDGGCPTTTTPKELSPSPSTPKSSPAAAISSFSIVKFDD